MRRVAPIGIESWLNKKLTNPGTQKVSFKSVSNSVNIAGRLPENSPNSFVDLQSQKTVKRTTKKIVFSLKADMLYFD